ncbi:MAG TPA: MFS transporter, partial [bacterium]|nr:MFS transporter [bacterium]
LVSRPWVGWWLDRGGARWGMLAAGCLYTLSAAGFWAARTVPALIGFRVLSGLAIALSSTSAQVLAIAMAPERRRGEALSLLGLANSIGQGAGPAAGIAVAAAAGYPVLFAMTGVLAACSTGLALMLRRRTPHTLRRGSNRLIHPAVFLPGTVLVAAMVTFGLNFALLAIHASRRGLANPGWVFAAFAVGQVLVQTVLRRVSDRFGRHAAIGPGLALIALGTWVTAAVPGWWLLLGGFLTGAGQGIVQPAIYAWGSDLVAAHEHGSAMGTLGVFLEIGIATGAIGGGIAGRAFGLGTTYLFAGSIAGTAAVAQRWVNRLPRKQSGQDS